MKTRFNTYDIVCGVAELQRLVGFRVNQIYDIDNKTYLLRLHGGKENEKATLLIESGVRFHTTDFEWPKNAAPGGFSMKMRKHLKNKRIEYIRQLGNDRIVDFQFGRGDVANHLFLELYDRGNIVLTDVDLKTMYILRPHTEGDRFAVHEKYPIDRAKKDIDDISLDTVQKLIDNAAPGESLKRVLMSLLDCGPAVIDHVLLTHELNHHVVSYTAKPAKTAQMLEHTKTKQPKLRINSGTAVEAKPFDAKTDLTNLLQAIKESRDIIKMGHEGKTKGYIIQVREEKPMNTETKDAEYFYRNIEFHPYLFAQHQTQPHAVFNSFMAAVDEFFSAQEFQKIDLKTLQQERDALKKLSNVKKDHAKRLELLNKIQDMDTKKAELIQCNQILVDKAILAVQSAIANQISWTDIHELVKEAQVNGDEVAKCIKQLDLKKNHISLSLCDPYKNDNDNGNSENSVIVDVDLALSAWANARQYYDQKRFAAKKEQKTVDASQKALKSAERKTQQTLKEVRIISTITKARKVFWFEKFYWFISSENYLIIGGRDAQQNELIVKRYMRPNDIYVHAEIQGASSIIIRNPSGEKVPPKTLLEAGTMAISYSVGWDAKVVTNAYWVQSNQVSKNAPTGEYLGTGSFMIRGKKNFLPPCHLVMGLSLLFKLEDSSVHRHIGERKVRSVEDEFELNIPEIKTRDLRNEAKQIQNNNGKTFESNIFAYPNTEIKIEHDTGRLFVNKESSFAENIHLEKITENCNTDESTLISAGTTRKKQQTNAKKCKEEKKPQCTLNTQTTLSSLNETDLKSTSKIKRGQKGKLKKIKSKYRDQDDEERELRMMILKSSGKEKPQPQVNESKDNKELENNKQLDQAELTNTTSNCKNNVELGENYDISAGYDVEMIDTLTGQPLEDDELLFAIPVVAPYQSLQQYKFKLKLIPGTGKRGRAAKVALALFSKDKSCNSREADLLKSIKEEALARNIPGKVKLSAPQQHTFRKH